MGNPFRGRIGAKGGIAVDNFREWLSDNLRYILLVAVGAVIVVALFIGVRALTGGGANKGNSSSSNQADTQSENQQASGNQAASGNVSSDALEKGAIPEVNELVQAYYKALGDKNIEALKETVKGLDPAEESKIANTKYIESYENVEVYTKKGLEEGSYVVFASFAYKCTDVETPAPALSQLYVVTDENDKLWISAEAVSDAEIQAYVSTIMGQADVIQLRNNVQAAYDQAQAGDPQLKAFLESLGGEDSGTPTPQPESPSDNSAESQEVPVASTEGMRTAIDDCNVRMAAESGTDIVTVVPAGEMVNVLGEENGWVQIEYGGIVGYVYRDLLQ